MTSLEELQPLAFATVTAYKPGVVTMSDAVFAPLFHRLPVALLLVRVTLPPLQKSVGPLARIVGVGGAVSTTRITVVQFALRYPSFTVYVMVLSPTGQAPLEASTAQVRFGQLSDTASGAGIVTSARHPVEGVNWTVSAQMITGAIVSTKANQVWQLLVWSARSRMSMVARVDVGSTCPAVIDAMVSFGQFSKMLTTSVRSGARYWHAAFANTGMVSGHVI